MLVGLFLFGEGTAPSQSGKTYTLKPTPQTVHTGFFDATILPALTIDSGDTVVSLARGEVGQRKIP